jgi:hypothetical protein
MEFNLQDTIALLTRTPAVLNALLRDLPETWTLANEGADTWSPFDIVGHLVHGERTDWMPRARMILQSGEPQTFAPFDRLGHVRAAQGKSLEQLLEEFASLRPQNLAALRAESGAGGSRAARATSRPRRGHSRPAIGDLVHS